MKVSKVLSLILGIIGLYPAGMDSYQLVHDLLLVLRKEYLFSLWTAKFLLVNSVMGKVTWMEAI